MERGVTERTADGGQVNAKFKGIGGKRVAYVVDTHFPQPCVDEKLLELPSVVTRRYGLAVTGRENKTVIGRQTPL